MWSDSPITRYSKTYAMACTLALTYLLAACSGLTQSDKPVTTTWWLEPYSGAEPVTAAPAVLPVALTLRVVPGLDTAQILTLSDDGELKPYAGARWADHLPELATSLVGRTLEASGRFELSHGLTGRAEGGCDLQLELRAFFADLDAQLRTTGVRVALHGRFQCESGEPVFFESHASVAVGGERMGVIVSAFQQAMDRVMQDMLNKLYKIQ